LFRSVKLRKFSGREAILAGYESRNDTTKLIRNENVIGVSIMSKVTNILVKYEQSGCFLGKRCRIGGAKGK
jgi:hypothetical protein